MNKHKVRGRIPALIELFNDCLRNTLTIIVPEGKYLVHVDGSVYHTQHSRILKEKNETSEHNT